MLNKSVNIQALTDFGSLGNSKITKAAVHEQRVRRRKLKMV